MDLAGLREEYGRAGLAEADLAPDPVTMFGQWMQEAVAAGLHEPNAMVVATVGADGAPSSRMVLLKGLSDDGFVFYTNTGSRKGVELAANPRCALLFPWHPLERQVRVEGVASRVDAGESDDYFRSRPRPAQVGAWSSPQSQVVESRDYLEQRFIHEQDRFAEHAEIPRPEHWGGIRVRPHRIEFWQGRPGRLHDRVRFDRVDESRWAVERLAP